MRDKREAFIEQQKEMREEFRKRISDLKDQLQDHKDAIDAATGKEGDLLAYLNVAVGRSQPL